MDTVTPPSITLVNDQSDPSAEPPMGTPAPSASSTTAPDNRRWWSLAVLAGGLSMIVLDGTIVGVAMPTIISDLGLALNDAQWVNAIYSVVFAALLMSFGSLGDLIGRRNIFAGGVAVFVLGSVWAALGSSASALLWSRALQGVGGAMVLPNSLSTVNATFRGKDRATAFGIWGAVMAGMAAVGPLLGGWLTTTISWRWIFWVNVPIGALVVLGAFLVTRDTKGDATHAQGRYDWLGLMLSIVGFGALVFAIIEGPEMGWIAPTHEASLFGLTWPANAAVSMAAVAGLIGAIGVVAFLTWERHRLQAGLHALLNLELFTIGTFSWGNIAALAVAVGEFALVFVLPLYLIGVLGLNTMGAGWVLAAMALGAFISGAMARHLAAAFGAAVVVVIGLGLEVLGVAALGFLIGTQTAAWSVALCLVVYGVGLGLAAAQLTSTVLADIPPAQSGQGAATQSTIRQIGSALGIAFSGSALAAGLDAFLLPGLDGIAGLSTAQAAELANAIRSSVGGSLVGLRAAAESGQLGRMGDAIVAALSTGFVDATRWSIWVALLFLVLGLIASFVVARAAKQLSTTK